MANLHLTKGSASRSPMAELSGGALQERMLKGVRIAEELGIDYLLVAQRWWGTARKSKAPLTTALR